jgi:hypothetical protein
MKIRQKNRIKIKKKTEINKNKTKINKKAKRHSSL